MFKKLTYLKILLAGVLFSLFIIGCAGDATTEVPDMESMDILIQEEGTVDEDGVGSVDNLDSMIDSISSNDSSTDATINEIGRLQEELNIVYFNFDVFNIREDMIDSLDENSEKLNSDSYIDKNIKVEGNSDEWGTDEYNYALGLKRAKSVKDYLSSEGVDEERISIVSFGESNPSCNEKTSDCWSKNRRVETKLLP